MAMIERVNKTTTNIMFMDMDVTRGMTIASAISRCTCGIVEIFSGRGGEGEISGLLVRAIACAHIAFIVHGRETATGNRDSVTIDGGVIRESGIDETDTDECVFRHHTTG